MLMDFLTEREREQPMHSDQQPAKPIVLSFFYHQLGEPEQRAGSALGLFRSLLFQLLDTDRNLLQKFVDDSRFVAQDKAMGMSWKWEEKDLQKHFGRYVRDHLPDGCKVVIYLDALNEAGDELSRVLAKYFKDLSDQCRDHIRVCIASHQYSLGSGPLIRASQYNFGASLEDENVADIKIYLESMLSEVYDRDQEVRPLEEALLARAGGVFQWLKWSAPKAVALFVGEDGVGEELEYVLKLVEGYPLELNDIYEQVVGSIASQEAALALRIFEWVTMAFRPLRVEELQTAICFETDAWRVALSDLQRSRYWCEDVKVFETRIRRLSCGLIRACTGQRDSCNDLEGAIYPDPRRLEFDHASVRNFMVTKGLTMLETKVLGRGRTQAERQDAIAQQCLLYLEAETVHACASAITWIQPADVLTLCRTVPQPIPVKHLSPGTLMFYAADYWHQHFGEAEINGALVSAMVDASVQMGTQIWTTISKLLEALRLGSFFKNIASVDRANSSFVHVLAACGLSRTLAQALEMAPSKALPQLVNVTDAGSCTPTWQAAKYGQAQCIDVLLRYGADVNIVSATGCSPLHIAAYNGEVDAVKSLLKSHSIDPNAEDNAKATALDYAAWFGSQSLQLMRLLVPVTKPDLRVGVVIGLLPPQVRGSPFFVAWARGSMEVFEYMLQSIRPGQTGEEVGSYSILHHMSDVETHLGVTKDLLAKAKLLMDSGKYNANLKSPKGETPLIQAVTVNNAAVVNLLLRTRDLQINEVDDNEESAFFKAVRLHEHDIVEALLGAENVNVNQRDSRWATPLHAAVDVSCKGLVHCLLAAHRLDAHAQDDLGFTPLIRAVRRGNVAVVHTMLLHDHWDIIESLRAEHFTVELAADEYRKAPGRTQQCYIYFALLYLVHDKTSAMDMLRKADTLTGVSSSGPNGIPDTHACHPLKVQNREASPVRAGPETWAFAPPYFHLDEQTRDIVRSQDEQPREVMIFGRGLGSLS